MAVIYYGPDKHPAGFVGFRVTTGYNGNFLQRYFNTSAATKQSNTDALFLYRRLEAELQYLEWQRESLLHRYHRFVTENHPNTRPERGVGVHGLTAAFIRQGKRGWQPCFKVSRFHNRDNPRQPAKMFTFSKLYSEVWEDTVSFWAEEHDVREADKIRVLNNAPEPYQFKRLRRQMNEKEGSKIPVEALSPAFAEQRSNLAKERAMLKAKEMKLHAGMPSTFNQDIQTEMAAWFENIAPSEHR